MESTREAISTLTAERLLGRPLNNVEKKYAPRSLFAVGAMEIPIPSPRVSIVGSRGASPRGLKTATAIAKRLAQNQVVVVSGLALGVDAAAHRSAIHSGGRTIAVVGTPVNRFYPSQNMELQKEIMRDHLVVSQFPIGHRTLPRDFPFRNRTMALVSDATIIVEAGDTSGTLSQGWETLRLGRPLFILESIMEDRSLKWPQKMLDYGAMVVSNPLDVLESLPSSQRLEEILV